MEMTNSSTEVWEVHSLGIGVIRFVGPCEYRGEKCAKPAEIRIEMKKVGGAAQWDGDYCHEHAERLVEEAKAGGIKIIDDEPALIRFDRSSPTNPAAPPPSAVINDGRSRGIIFRRESTEKVRQAY